MTSAERFAVEAEGLVGTKFLPHGRDPALGLDCAGLVIVAAQRGGVPWSDISYALVADADLFSPMLAILESLCDRVEPSESVDQWQRGDVLALRFPPMNNHLAIYLGRRTMVHAYDHKAQRRVILTSMDYALIKRVHSAWRLRTSDACQPTPSLISSRSDREERTDVK